jgi:hypothetical protein
MRFSGFKQNWMMKDRGMRGQAKHASAEARGTQAIRELEKKKTGQESRGHSPATAATWEQVKLKVRLR